MFDVDGTLFPPTSMEKLFIFYLLKKGQIPLANVGAYFFAALVQVARKNWEDGFKNNKLYLRNLSQDRIERLAGALLQRQIIPGLAKTGLRQMEQLRAADYRILLMSGSPDFLTLPLARYLKVDYCITTRMAVANGRFTGQTASLHPYGARKSRLLWEHQEELALDFAHSIVFANHHADADHMALFAQAVAVNPTAKLQQIARSRNWAIEWWR